MDFSGMPSEVQFLHHYQGMNRRKPYDKISIRPDEVYIVLGREWIVKGTTLKDVKQRHDVSVKVNLQDGGLHTSVNKGAQEKQLQDKESILWQGDITNSQSAFYPHAQVVLTDNQLIINGVNVQWSLPVPPVNISIPAWSTQNACNDYGKLVRAAMSTFSQLSDHYQIQSAGLNVAF